MADSTDRTPKTRGRPKKGSKTFNFRNLQKPKKLDFTNDTKSDENDNDRNNDITPDISQALEESVPKSINSPYPSETNHEKSKEVNDADHINETLDEDLMEFDDKYYSTGVVFIELHRGAMQGDSRLVEEHIQGVYPGAALCL